MRTIPGQPIREGMRADFAYTHIKRLILEGQFSGGDRLDVNAFVQQLEISRQPVVRALARLADDGFVEIVPQVGCWVARADPTEIGDFFRLFAVTEALTAELAAARHEAAELEELRAIDGRIKGQLGRDRKPGDPHAYRMLNRAFHGQVHTMARSALLKASASGMWDRCDFFLCTLGSNLIAARASDSYREHAKLIDAIANRDADAARLLMQEHVAAFGKSAIAAAKSLVLVPKRQSRT
jgi:DNA-binding GntR family transcriptional regulator